MGLWLLARSVVPRHVSDVVRFRIEAAQIRVFRAALDSASRQHDGLVELQLDVSGRPKGAVNTSGR